jgi:hypothetical protein
MIININIFFVTVLFRFSGSLPLQLSPFPSGTLFLPPAFPSIPYDHSRGQ